MLRDDPVTAYVCTEAAHHLAKAWQTDAEADDRALVHWLGDVPQDELVLSSARVLGERRTRCRSVLHTQLWRCADSTWVGCVGADRLASSATRAEERGDWWMAGRYWALGEHLRHWPRAELAKKALVAMARFLAAPGQATSRCVVPRNMDYPRTRWSQPPQIVMQCASTSIKWP